MTQVGPRASYVTLDLARHRLCVVYPGTVARADLILAAANFQTETGFRAYDLVLPPQGGRGRMAFVVVAWTSGKEFVAAMAVLKRITNPRLPITLQALDLGLSVCRCNLLRTHLKCVEFLPGFAPADVANFRKYLAASVRRHVSPALVSEDLQPPHSLLQAKVRGVLFDQRAHATQLNIQLSSKIQKCQH